MRAVELGPGHLPRYSGGGIGRTYVHPLGHHVPATFMMGGEVMALTVDSTW